MKAENFFGLHRLKQIRLFTVCLSVFWKNKNKNKVDKKKIASEVIGHLGKVISWSKSSYKYDNPKNLIVFNAVVKDSKKDIIWTGDLDLTLEEANLMRLAKQLHEELFVYPELVLMQEEPFIYMTDGQNKFEFGPRHKDYKKINNVIMYDRT